MTAPVELTWDLPLLEGGARRASLEDCGNALLEDEDPFPDEDRHPSARKLNQWAKQIAALNRMIGSAGIEVRYSGGVPTVTAATGPGTAVVPSLFTPTDTGTGDVTISWPSGALPVPILAPMVTRNTLAAGDTSAAYVTTLGVITGVRVRSFDGSSNPMDADFTVIIR